MRVCRCQQQPCAAKQIERLACVCWLARCGITLCMRRFWVRQEQLFEFLKHWVGRESLLQHQPGFLGMQVGQQAGRHVCTCAMHACARMRERARSGCVPCMVCMSVRAWRWPKKAAECHRNRCTAMCAQVQPQVGLTPDGGVDVVVSSLWESIPLWEAWSKSDAARQQHMPTGAAAQLGARDVM